MPLRDHFRPPVDLETCWEGFHGAWPTLMVMALNRLLTSRYVAEPRLHHGAFVEVDVATLEKDQPRFQPQTEQEGGVATLAWAPPQATFSVKTELAPQDEYEVRVYDSRRNRRLVAAIEIVSPANKDRPEHRRAFVVKCAALLQKQVFVAIIDLVTIKNFNLYAELLEMFGHPDPAMPSDTPSLYAAACRATNNNESGQLDTWAYPLTLGSVLPTLPLWLSEDYSVPLELESSYEETCRILRIS